ncbi:MAG: hypothetical protein M0Q88_02780 [Bacilli bacterium]|nr:hypothetical protein [Bacilli bacterium]
MDKSEINGRDLVKNSLLINDEDIVISKSPFSAFENIESEELVYKGSTTYMNAEHITLQVHMGYLKVKDDDTIDLEILKALDELEFAISRMITIYLNLKGIDIHQKKVQKRLSYLNRLRIISSYELKSTDKDGNIKKSPTPIYFLDKASVFILKSQGIKTNYRLETALKSKNGIKEILSRNQLMLKYTSTIKNINFTKNNPTYKLQNGNEYQPHLQIVFDNKGKNQYILFEFIRSYDGWQDKLINKLDKCKYVIESFTPSKTIPSVPLVILVAEDDKHALDIMKLIIKNDLTIKNSPYLFTTDNRTLTSPLNQSIFRFGVEDNKPVIKTLSIELFNIV